MLSDGQRIKWRRNIAENFNRLSRVHERNRQTDRRQTNRRTDDDGIPRFGKKQSLHVGLGNVIVHLRLIGKLVVDFLLVLIELFSPGVTLTRYERILIGNRRI